MPESVVIKLIQDIFAYVTEGGMAEVMPQADCFGQILIKVQGSSYGARYLGYLYSVGKPCSVVVTQGSNENLRLVLEAAESL